MLPFVVHQNSYRSLHNNRTASHPTRATPHTPPGPRPHTSPTPTRNPTRILLPRTAHTSYTRITLPRHDRISSRAQAARRRARARPRRVNHHAVAARDRRREALQPALLLARDLPLRLAQRLRERARPLVVRLEVFVEELAAEAAVRGGGDGEVVEPVAAALGGVLDVAKDREDARSVNL